MTLLEMMRALGDRFKLLETVEEAVGPAPEKIRTRAVSLSELVGRMQEESARALEDIPVDLSAPFEKILEAAGIRTAEHGWDLPRLQTLLAGEPFRNLDREGIQSELVRILSGARVDVEDLVTDAMERDRALDMYEAKARDTFEKRRSAAESRISALDSRIGQLQQERDRLTGRMRDDEEEWSGWVKRKRAYERELAAAIGYLIDRPVVTTGEEED